jgi:hypothetical protein
VLIARVGKENQARAYEREDLMEHRAPRMVECDGGELRAAVGAEYRPNLHAEAPGCTMGR